MHLPVVVGKRLADVLTEQGASRSTGGSGMAYN